MHSRVFSICAAIFWGKESGDTAHDLICVPIKTSISLLTVYRRKGKKLAKIHIDLRATKFENLFSNLPGTRHTHRKDGDVSLIREESDTSFSFNKRPGLAASAFWGNAEHTSTFQVVAGSSQGASVNLLPVDPDPFDGIGQPSKEGIVLVFFCDQTRSIVPI